MWPHEVLNGPCMSILTLVDASCAARILVVSCVVLCVDAVLK